MWEDGIFKSFCKSVALLAVYLKMEVVQEEMGCIFGLFGVFSLK